MPKWKASALVTVSFLLTPACVWAEEACTTPMRQWQPQTAIIAQAKLQGLTIEKVQIENGCYHIRAHDATGVSLMLLLDPATLAPLPPDDVDDQPE